MPEQILTIEQIEELHKRAVGGPLLLPLRVEHWHWGMSGGGWYVRHSTGRILMTVEFVEAEIASGKPALDGNAPARAVVDLLNAVPALCNTVRALRAKYDSLKSKIAWHRDGVGPDVPVLQERYDNLIAQRNDLQSRLSEVEKERSAEREAHMVTIENLSETLAKYDALRDFRTYVINLCNQKAAEWRSEAGRSQNDYARACREKANLLTELVTEIENLDHQGE